MNKAGKRCLRVTRVQVQKALLPAKAKSIGESDQGSERISSTARSRGQETQHDYWRLIFSFNRLTLTPGAPIFVYKRSAAVSSRRAGCPNCRPTLSVSYWPIGRPVMTRPCASCSLAFTANCGESHTVICETNGPTTLCKVLPSSTRPICGWKSNTQVRSRTASISSLSARN